VIHMGAPGCDDAPLIAIPQAEQMTKDHLTFIYPYYENPQFLAKQLVGWKNFPDELRAKLRVIIVDDGSPRHPAVDVVREAKVNFQVRVFRIGVDVRWNWLAARNIGAHHAMEGWMLLTDMDHVVIPDVLQSILHGLHDDKIIYRFSRVGAKSHPHPNSWLMTRKMFWKIGGYDENCSGFYGTDGDYRRRCASAAAIRILTDPLVCVEHELDSSTIDYLRKQPEDARAKMIMRARRKGWKPKVLSFPYKEMK